MMPVVETVCANALYVDNVQLALALVTDFILAEARYFFIQYHPVLVQ